MARVGIIGGGWGARVQAPAFRDAGFDVVTAGRDDWRALLQRDDVDLVSIVTPPSEHREMTLAALAGGKHVVCEKPTALDAAEAEEMLAAAGAHGDRITIIDHELRFLPAWRAARAAIGELGGLRYAEVRYSSPSRGDRSRAWNWWSDAARGGGVWGAVGSHYVDALRYFGFEIEAAQASLQTVIGERSSKPVTSDDFAAVHLRLAGGAIAAMTFSSVAAVDEPTTLTLHGERGAFRLTGEEWLRADRGWNFVRAAGSNLSDAPGNSLGGAFGSGTIELARALRAALEGDRDALAPAATFADGLAQQRVLDAARASARGGGWVAIRPPGE